MNEYIYTETIGVAETAAGEDDEPAKFRHH